MTPTLSERARELVEWLREQVTELNEGIQEYNAGCPAQLRAIAVRDKLQSRAECVESLLAENAKLRATVPDGWVLVPQLPTEEMWGGLARWIVLWARTGPRATGASLYAQLRATGEAIPSWLYDEIRDIDHVQTKGTVAAVIYRAMLDARPALPPPLAARRNGMNIGHFTDELISAVLDGCRAMTPDEREFIIADTPNFEECSADVASELPVMSDPDLMRAAFDVWADYASGRSR